MGLENARAIYSEMWGEFLVSRIKGQINFQELEA